MNLTLGCECCEFSYTLGVGTLRGQFFELSLLCVGRQLLCIEHVVLLENLLKVSGPPFLPLGALGELVVVSL